MARAGEARGPWGGAGRYAGGFAVDGSTRGGHPWDTCGGGVSARADRRAVLVTGASRGIGAAIAGALATRGWFVHLAARDRAACEAVAARIRASGGGAEALALDVADPSSVRVLARRLAERAPECGETLALVNNAGVADSAPLIRSDGTGADELCERLFAVNFHGARRCFEALLPRMRRAGFGRVVNIASSAALRGYPYVSAYCASKHALLGYARAAALELKGTGVTVATVCPHYVDTPLTDQSARRIAEKTGRSLEQARSALAAQNPSGLFVTPEEVAEAVVTLIGSGANGAVLELPGNGEVIVREEIGGARDAPEIVLPEGWVQPKGYSNGVVAPRGSRLLSVAGQVAFDAQGRLVGQGDFVAQFRQALANVLAVVEAAGGNAESLLSMTVYVTDKRRYLERLRELGEVWRQCCGRHYPAMALVEVAGLVEEGALLEIQALAAVS